MRVFVALDVFEITSNTRSRNVEATAVAIVVSDVLALSVVVCVPTKSRMVPRIFT